MLFIQRKKPKLNAQSDSIKEKLFSTQLTHCGDFNQMQRDFNTLS